MIGLLQRVSWGKVTIAGHTVASIGPGLLVLVGIVPADTLADASRLLDRLLQYRVFADDRERMNRSLRDVHGALLLVPQFTLAADTTNGLRPSFTGAAPPEVAKPLFEAMLAAARNRHAPVAGGVFGADMQVSLSNDGPVTFWLES
jgi:D-tyrosyl-tRNA(Tyr) deacylase